MESHFDQNPRLPERLFLFFHAAVCCSKLLVRVLTESCISEPSFEAFIHSTLISVMDIRVRRSAPKVLDAKTPTPRSRITPRLKSCLNNALETISGRYRVFAQSRGKYAYQAQKKSTFELPGDNSRVLVPGLPSEIRVRVATSAVQDFWCRPPYEFHMSQTPFLSTEMNLHLVTDLRWCLSSMLDNKMLSCLEFSYSKMAHRT